MIFAVSQICETVRSLVDTGSLAGGHKVGGHSEEKQMYVQNRAPTQQIFAQIVWAKSESNQFISVVFEFQVIAKYSCTFLKLSLISETYTVKLVLVSSSKPSHLLPVLELPNSQ